MTKYDVRKAQKRCVRCGAKDEATIAGRAHCAACAKTRRDGKRDEYWQRRAEKRCIKCGLQDEKTLAGRCRCSFCGKKAQLLNTKYNSERMKNYYIWKAEGKCTVCGADRDNGTLLCSKCRALQKRATMRYELRQAGVKV